MVQVLMQNLAKDFTRLFSFFPIFYSASKMTSQQKARMADSLTSTFENMGKGKEAESDTLYMSRHLIRRLAAPLLPMMGLGPGTAGPVRLLDTACGTGVVVAELQGENGLPRDVLAQSSFICADNAQGMIDLVQKRIENEGWVNVEAKVLDAQVCTQAVWTQEGYIANTGLY